MILALAIISLVLLAVNIVFEYSRDLMMLQQNSYRYERYGHWLKVSKDSTSPWRIAGLIVLFFAISPMCGVGSASVLLSVFGLVSAISLASKKYKKPLVWTNRVRRIFAVMVALTLVFAAVAAVLNAGPQEISAVFAAAVAVCGCYCGSHIVVVVANWLLQPVEKAINRKYYRDAVRRLAERPDLKIVGVTGSYGKTSTKHYLHRILSEHFDTLMTPGSFNTTLGVVRTVREHLKPYHEVFIVEMGAKQLGDIKEICDLVRPSVGIVTAVGPQHLESFKTIDNVQATKFELVDALPSDGLAVVNNDFEKIAERKVANVECCRYAVRDTSGASYTADDIVYSPTGTSFTVKGPDGYSLPLHTRLVGECNISNLLAAVAVARHLGVPDKKIAYAVGRIDQVEHRLSIKRTPGGLTVIDDAFNSNPVGSGMALDVLAGMSGGKRIVITPGMIELGDRQYELNREFGRHIDAAADVAVIVGKYNRDAISEGIADGGRLKDDAVHKVDTFAGAQALIASIVKPGDVVLYENDLPDTFK